MASEGMSINDDKPPSNRDKDTTNNDDRPPPDSDRGVQWDFIRFGLRQKRLGIRLLDVVYDKH